MHLMYVLYYNLLQNNILLENKVEKTKNIIDYVPIILNNI